MICPAVGKTILLDKSYKSVHLFQNRLVVVVLVITQLRYRESVCWIYEKVDSKIHTSKIKISLN